MTALVTLSPCSSWGGTYDNQVTQDDVDKVKELTGLTDLDRALIESTLTSISYDIGGVSLGKIVKLIVVGDKLYKTLNEADNPNLPMEEAYLKYVEAKETLEINAATTAVCVSASLVGLGLPCTAAKIALSPITATIAKLNSGAIAKQWAMYMEARNPSIGGCKHIDILNGIGDINNPKCHAEFYFPRGINDPLKNDPRTPKWIVATGGSRFPGFPNYGENPPDEKYYWEVFEIAKKMYEFKQESVKSEEFKTDFSKRLRENLLNQTICYTDPIELKPFTPVSGKTCAGTFQRYKFPVIADGREYQVILKPIYGNPDLYASRYPQFVDDLQDIQNWSITCPPGEDFCAASNNTDTINERVHFIAPTGEPGYYSWLAIYGNEDSQYPIIRYTIEVVYKTPWKMSPVWNGDVNGPTDSQGRQWYDVNFDDSGWGTIRMPYRVDDSGNNDRFFRQEIELETQNMEFSKNQRALLWIASNDGVWIYVNGRFVGHLGADWRRSGCVNDFTGTCTQNVNGAPLDITEFLAPGHNVIAIQVSNGEAGTLLQTQLSIDQMTQALQAVPNQSVPEIVSNGFINLGETKSFSFTNMIRQNLDFALNWNGSAMKLTIYRPDGSLYGGEFISATPPIHISIPDAEAGGWLVEVTAVDVPHNDYAYSLIVSSPFDVSKDSEGDGVPDYWEEFFGSDKYVNDAFLDADSDGLTNKQEFDLRINPVASDTDMDGLADNNEVSIGTDPGNPDTDGDGFSDGDEVNRGTNPGNPGSKPDSWVARYNGANNTYDQARNIAVDTSGNVYITGISDNSIATVKYDANGTQVWTTRYNGAGYYTSSAIDDFNNLYVAGSIQSGSTSDYITIKYDVTGTQLWDVRYSGGCNGDNVSKAMTLDKSGNVYVTGASCGSYTTIKYNTNGNPLWVTRYNASGYGGYEPTSIAIDGSNNVYITGWVQSNIFSGYVTVKYDSSGNQLWAVHYTGGRTTGEDPLIAVDVAGNVYITGVRESSITYQDIATIKYDTNGMQLWEAIYNGPGSDNRAAADIDVPTAITVDASGNVYITGYSDSQRGGYDWYDYVTIKYDTDGSPLWIARYDTGNNFMVHDIATALAVSSFNFIPHPSFSFIPHFFWVKL